MKITERYYLVKHKEVLASPAWRRATEDVEAAVAATDWPHGSGKFSIFPESGKKRGMGNGVDAIKIPCIQKLKEFGWQVEAIPKLSAGTLTTGDLDGLLMTDLVNIAFEWETGNLSSSHRAINMLLHSLMFGGIIGGFLVVPSDGLKTYLTDRVGNIGELRPYFPLRRKTRIPRGALEIIAVEHDETSIHVPRIPKRTDGRSAF